MNKLLALVTAVAVFIIFIPFSVSADSIVIEIDDVNGSRGENQTILYNNSGETTGTNEWGCEISVTCGVVTSVEGFNNIIPYGENSFVVSGHGTAGDVLKSVTVGMKAVFDSKEQTVTFIKDSDTHKVHIDIARSTALQAKNNAEKQCLAVDKNADVRLRTAEEKYSSLDGDIDEARAEALIKEYNYIASLFRERSVSQYRAIWITPSQKNYAEVEAFVRKCAESGINTISLETFTDGTMICPMPADSLFEQNPDLNDFDLLGAFVEVSHKYNIELHCWMPNFISGNTLSRNWERTLAAKKPEWRLLTNHGSPFAANQTDGNVYLNPALEEVRETLAESYRYILENYDIDGFELDYIRYEGSSATDDFGYDYVTIEKFKAEYPQYSSYEIIYDKTADYWTAWVDFRASQVSEFVKLMRETIDQTGKDIILSADVGSVSADSYNVHYQDSKRWLSEGWLDMIHPMAYGEFDADNVATFFSNMPEGCLMVPILGIYRDIFDAEDMFVQTSRMFDVGCHGIGYFAEEAFFSKNCGAFLGETLFTEPAVAPHFNNSNTTVAELCRFVERLETAHNSNYITDEDKSKLASIADKAIHQTKASSAKDAKEIIKQAITYLETNLEETALRNRLQLDLKNAYFAAISDNGDDYDETIGIVTAFPESAQGKIQLTIDKINSVHKGEDSIIITDPEAMSDCYVNYAYVMLLSPVEEVGGVYELVEAAQNYGTPGTFKTQLKEGMIVVSFHTDETGGGLERRNLARTVSIGSEFVLWGIDAATGEYTALYSMLYEYTRSSDAESTIGDVNGDGDIDQYDYILVKRHYFETRILSENEALRADVNKDGKIDQYDYILICRHYFGTYTIA